MANRKGVFIGAYVPPKLKEALQQRAAREYRTLSKQVELILEEAIKRDPLPPGFIDRPAPGSPTRRRQSDPLPRRRREEVLYVPEQPAGERE